MGKALSTSSDYGNISIQLDKPKYTAGDQVNGFIYLSLMKNFPSNVMYLIISGKEKVKLVTTTSVQDADNNMKTQVLIHKDKNEFFAHTFPLFSQAGSFFPYGQYSFPFTFKLLDNLPGTFIDNWDEHGEKCYAMTQYKLWAGMKEPRGQLALFTKQFFSVDQKWEYSSGVQSKQYQKNLKGYCYSDLGEFKIMCHFEKDKFFVGENANMSLEIDNSRCKSDVSQIKCQLIQNTKYQTNGKPNLKFKSQVLSETMISGIKSGEMRVGQNAFPIILNVKTQSESQASSNHNLIQNSFSLSISTKMNDCLCCETDPSTSIDVKIFNRLLPQSNFVPPVPGWNPQVMNPYVCTISNEYRMTSDFKNQIFVNTSGNYPQM